MLTSYRRSTYVWTLYQTVLSLSFHRFQRVYGRGWRPVNPRTLIWPCTSTFSSLSSSTSSLCWSCRTHTSRSPSVYGRQRLAETVLQKVSSLKIHLASSLIFPIRNFSGKERPQQFIFYLCCSVLSTYYLFIYFSSFATKADCLYHSRLRFHNDNVFAPGNNKWFWRVLNSHETNNLSIATPRISVYLFIYLFFNIKLIFY